MQNQDTELTPEEKDDLEKRFAPERTIDESDFKMSQVNQLEHEQEESQPPQEKESKFKTIVAVGDQDKFDEMLDKDFDTVRDNIIHLTEFSDDMLENIKALARESESPRAFEVMMDSLVKFKDLNTSIIDLYHRREEIRAKKKKNDDSEGGEKENPSGNYTQNNQYVFNGSTADLLKEINSSDGGNGFEE